MKKTSISAIAAIATLGAATSFGAPQGYENQDGFWLGGALNVSPFASFSFLHDDNPSSMNESTKKILAEHPELKEKYEATDAYTYKAGVDLLLPGNKWKLSGRAFVLSEQYASDYSEDRTDWSEQLKIEGKTEGGTKWSLSQMSQNIRYDDTFEISQDDRTATTFNGSLEKRVTDKTAITLGAFYRDYKYDDRENSDNNSLGGSVGIAKPLTDKTDWTFSAGYTTHDKDEYDSTAKGLNARVGLRSTTSDKVNLNLSMGFEKYTDFDYTYTKADGSTVTEDGDDEYGFVYNLAATWTVTPRLTAKLAGYGDYSPSSSRNSASVYSQSVALSLGYRPGDNWNLNAGISFVTEDYTRDIVVPAATQDAKKSAVYDRYNRTDDKVGLFARASYDFTRYCSIYGSWNYSDISSSYEGNNYDRQRTSIGISLRY